ncbi:MAG: hypothetical protein U0744_02925 [Gemmataceae bacterium]
MIFAPFDRVGATINRKPPRLLFGSVAAHAFGFENWANIAREIDFVRDGRRRNGE